MPEDTDGVTLAERVQRKRRAYVEQLELRAQEIMAQLNAPHVQGVEAPRASDLIRALIRLEIERYDLEQLQSSPFYRAAEKGLTKP